MRKSQFKIGVVLAYLLIFVNLIYGFFISPFLIQKLTSANYGAYKTISSLMGTVSVLDFGISSTVIRYLSKFFSEKDKQSSESFLGMVTYQALLIIFVIVAAGISLYFCLDNIYGSSDLGTNVDPGLVISKKLYILLLINTVISVPYSIFNSIIVAHKDYLFANLSKILRIVFQFVALLIVVPLPFWNGSTLSVGIVLVLTSFIFLLVDAIYVFKKIRMKINFKVKLMPKWIIKESFLFSILSFVQTILIQFEGNIDNILIGKFISSEAVTTYSLAILFYSVFNQLSTAISNLLLPSVSQKIADGATNHDLEKLIIKVGRIQFMLLGGALFGFIACGRLFISVWVGEEQNIVWLLAIILLSATLLPLVENTALAIIRAKNKILFRTIAVLIGTVFNFSLTFAVVSIFEIDYQIKLLLACVGTATSLIGANVIAMNLYYKKVFGFRPIFIFKSIFSRTIVCLIPPLILTSLIVLLLDTSWLSFIFSALLFILVYAICLYFYALNDEEQNIIFGKFIKFSNHKEYILKSGKKIVLFPDDFFIGLSFIEKKQIIQKEINYHFDDTSFNNIDDQIFYDDNHCCIIDESKNDKYIFTDFLKSQKCNLAIIICHREFIKFYKKDFCVTPVLKTTLFSKQNKCVLKPKRKKTNLKITTKNILKSSLLSFLLCCLSFGVSYVTIDFSPEQISTTIKNKYTQDVFCKVTPSSYPINPFFSSEFGSNQASIPSYEYFYSKNYLNENNSIYIFEKNSDFSPIQYKVGADYIDSTLISSKFVSLNDDLCFSKLNLNLLISSSSYDDDDENVVSINEQLAIELFGSIESSLDKYLNFYLIDSQQVRRSRQFRIVSVFEYANQDSYYSINLSKTLFVTNPKTISLGWSGFEYLFSLPHSLDLLNEAISKVLQIERTYKYNHSFFIVESNNQDSSLINVTSELNSKIKKYDSPNTIALIVCVVLAYLLICFLYAKNIFDIKNNYFNTVNKKEISLLTIVIFFIPVLAIDCILLYLFNIYFVFKILLVPIIGFLILSLLFPKLFIYYLGRPKR